MQLHYGCLSIKDRRRCAAVEADKLARGGLAYIGNLLGIDDEIIQRGKRELEVMMEAADDAITAWCQCKAGGGRKKRQLETET